jgi:hypothetical protein
MGRFAPTGPHERRVTGGWYHTSAGRLGPPPRERWSPGSLGTGDGTTGRVDAGSPDARGQQLSFTRREGAAPVAAWALRAPRRGQHREVEELDYERPNKVGKQKEQIEK